MIELKGIAWDHPRGYEPLIACSTEFSKRNPQVRINWDIRSLKEFGDMPIEDFIGRYDLITIDHPYMGQADANNLLVKLEDYLDDATLQMHEKQSVGPSFQSYAYQKHLYALPIDAAALVASYREDILSEIGIESLPNRRKDLIGFYKKLPGDLSVAWALCPTDLWCAFLSIAAQDGGRDFIKNCTIDRQVASRSLDEIKRHLEYIHPESINWNPIQILDRMGNDDELVYAPYLFGYTNYSREGYSRKPVRFTDSPLGLHQDISSILGGVGLSISAQCKEVKTAVEYLKLVSSPEIQKGIYTQNGGQPANLLAWECDENNNLCTDFFKNTLSTMEKAYVRPQHPRWNNFQEQGAAFLHKGIQKNINSDILAKQLNELYNTVVNHE